MNTTNLPVLRIRKGMDTPVTKTYESWREFFADFQTLRALAFTTQIRIVPEDEQVVVRYAKNLDDTQEKLAGFVRLSFAIIPPEIRLLLSTPIVQFEGK